MLAPINSYKPRFVEDFHCNKPKEGLFRLGKTVLHCSSPDFSRVFTAHDSASGHLSRNILSWNGYFIVYVSEYLDQHKLKKTSSAMLQLIGS